jgi:signal transduction histidine kinase
MDLAPDLPRVMADSIEATKRMKAASELTIKSQQSDRGQLVISVSDTGVGLAAHQADQIFAKPDGIGMGLPICRSIVESHGGRLWADSSSGRGPTFRFTLPGEAEVGENERHG